MADGGSPEVHKTILLRSSTPAPSEKVLLYLEGMAQSGAYDEEGYNRDSRFTQQTHITDVPPPDPSQWDPTSPKMTKLPSTNGIYSPIPQQSRGTLEELQNSEVSYEGQEEAGDPAENEDQDGDGDAASNVQQGTRSEARSVHSHNTGAHDEPGPDSGPGPRYESYGSSFGNFGPLPDSFAGQPSWNPHSAFQHTPARAAGIPLPEGSAIMSPKSNTRNVLSPTMEDPHMTPRTTSMNIDVESPSNPGRSGNGISRAASRQSQRSDASRATAKKQPQEQITVTVGVNGTTIHVAPSPTRSPSRAPTDRNGDDRPLSPLSLSSQVQSIKSRAKSQAKSERPTPSIGTRYPPLPPSTRAVSPTERSAGSPDLLFGKAPSKSPSKSPSHAGSQLFDNNPRSIHEVLDAAGSSHDLPPASTKEPSVRHATSIRGMSESGEHAPDSLTRNGSHRTGGGSKSKPNYNHPLTELFAMRQAAGSAAGSAMSGHRSSHSAISPQQRRRDLSGESPSSHAHSRALSPPHSHTRQSRTSGMSRRDRDPLATPTPSRPLSPDMLEDYETEIVRDVLNKTPRTSYAAPSALETDIQYSHFHDMDLCILLHAADDPMAHDVVKKAVRKAVRARVKKLGLKHDQESIKAYRKSFHDHDPNWHLDHPAGTAEEPPAWAKGMMDKLSMMEQRVAALGPKIESMKSPNSSQAARTSSHRQRSNLSHRTPSELQDDEYEQQTPRTQTIPIGTQMTGITMDESMYRPPDTEFTARAESTRGVTMPGSMHHHDGSSHGPVADDEFEDENETHAPNGRTYTAGTPPTQDGDGNRRYRRDVMSTDRGDSPGQQYLEEEIYKLRVREPSQSAVTHRSWEIAREGRDDDTERQAAATESEMPEIMDNGGNVYEDHRQESPPLPPLPSESRDVVPTPGTPNNDQAWLPDGWNQEPPLPPPWQRIHQRLLNWAIVWPVSELDTAINSTYRGAQVDEVALSIWSTQQYKRYVRQQLTEVPPGRVDRLFVPPNMADAINNAVFHGRHGDACGMLRDLWAPFGLEGMPRIIIVLCRHRSDPSHWVAHKFSLPDGTLSTYDTYPEKCLPDGRPLGWWFAIRIAWPAAMYPSPDHLMQKMVRLHRPMQLAIDNSVAAAGIWRNLLMSSRAERPVDLERLRDLINTEVKNLRQRKEQGKLSIAAPRPNWEEMGG